MSLIDGNPLLRCTTAEAVAGSNRAGGLMKLVGRLLVAVALVSPVLIVAGPASPASAAVALSYNSHDNVRCNGGYFDGTLGGGQWTDASLIAHCTFNPTAEVGEMVAMAALRAKAGTTTTIASGGWRGALIQNNGNPGATITCDAGILKVGPQTGLSAGQFTFEHDGAVHTGSCNYWANGSQFNTTWSNSVANSTTCGTGQGVFTQDWGGCLGTMYAHNKTRAELVTIGWTGLDDYVNPHACAGLTITGPSGSQPFASGDSLTFSITVSPTYLVHSVEYRLGVSDPWHEMVPPGHIGNGPFTDVVAWPSKFAGKTPVEAGLELRCAMNEAGVIVLGYKLWTGTGWAADPSLGQNACEAATIKWPGIQVQRAAGDGPLWYIFSPSSSGQIEDIEYAIAQPGVSPPVQYSAMTWSNISITKGSTGSTLGTAVSPQPLPLGTQGYFAVTLGFDGSSSQVKLRCKVGGVWYYNFQWVASYWADHDLTGAIAAGTAFEEESCWDSIDVKFLEPSSWVPALVKSASCILKFLFIPQSDSVDALMTSAEDCAEHAPISYVVEGGDFLFTAFTGAPGAVAANREDDFVVFAGMYQDGVAIPAASGNFDAVAAGMGDARTIIGVCFWIGTVWGFYSITRRLVFR